MPTETRKSPLNIDPNSLMTIASAAPGAIDAGEEAFNDPTLAGYKKKNIVTRGLAGFQTGNKALAEGIFGFDPTSYIASKVTGQEYEAGTHIGGQEYNKEPEPSKYTTNIDPMTGEEEDLENTYGNTSPLPMTGKPLKMLTGINSPMTYKMSAAQYKSAVKMSEISGASTLPSALTLKGDQYKIDANKDGEITGEDFKLLKNK